MKQQLMIKEGDDEVEPADDDDTAGAEEADGDEAHGDAEQADGDEAHDGAEPAYVEGNEADDEATEANDDAHEAAQAEHADRTYLGSLERHS